MTSQIPRDSGAVIGVATIGAPAIGAGAGPRIGQGAGDGRGDEDLREEFPAEIGARDGGIGRPDGLGGLRGLSRRK